eukprot:6912471-Pyramimonas_sp.AAC.1
MAPQGTPPKATVAGQGPHAVPPKFWRAPHRFRGATGPPSEGSGEVRTRFHPRFDTLGALMRV